MAESTQALVLFRCGGALCALPYDAVAQIAAAPRLSVPPGLPRLLLGFANVGGRAIPALDGRRLLGVEEATEPDMFDRHLLILSDSADPVALVVDRVLDVRFIPTGMATTVRTDITLNGCVTAEIADGDAAIHVLAVDRILFAAEKARLVDLRAAAQARLDEWLEAPA